MTKRKKVLIMTAGFLFSAGIPLLAIWTSSGTHGRIVVVVLLVLGTVFVYKFHTAFYDAIKKDDDV